MGGMVLTVLMNVRSFRNPFRNRLCATRCQDLVDEVTPPPGVNNLI